MYEYRGDQKAIDRGLNSCDAEYTGQYNALKDASWLYLLPEKIEHPQTTSTHISPTTSLQSPLASNPEYNARIKHVNIRSRYIREKEADAGAEFNTKSLEKIKFTEFLSRKIDKMEGTGRRRSLRDGWACRASLHYLCCDRS